MAHFARIDENGIVETIIVVANEAITDEDGIEQESVGQNFLASIGLEGTWVQCSYNGNFRGIYPQPGAWFDYETDKFYRGPRPYPSWLYSDEDNCWLAPKNRPETDELLFWDESSLSWQIIPDYPEDGENYTWDEEAGEWVVPSE